MVLPLSVDVGPSRRPWANWALIVLTVVVFFATTEVGLLDTTEPHPLMLDGVGIGLLGHVLLHADFMHLLFNMMTFFFFGFQLERYIGTVQFIVLYLLGLLISHAGTYYKQRRNPEYASLGASGAISAVLFAAIVYFPQMSLYVMFIPIPIPAPLFAVLYLLYTYYAAKHPRGRINHDAHLGGAITGLLFVALTEPRAYGYLLQSIF
jgi:membrane associated rhomboid family serine protease